MIKSFRGKGAGELFAHGTSSKVSKTLHARAIRILDALHQAEKPSDMNVPGWDFHPLKGPGPTRYSVHINGPWCVTFEIEDGHAVRVDIEQYH
jgi:proteic killer suppression protein